jgi:mannose-6-phosphate isomerase-like protein (cupin superfamily)
MRNHPELALFYESVMVDYVSGGSFESERSDVRSSIGGMTVDVRRVVTGHDNNGKAIFVSDEMVAPITMDLLPGNDFHRLWGSNERASFPDDGAQPFAESYFPPLDGYRFGFFTIPPNWQHSSVERDPVALRAEFEEKVPGLAEHLEDDHPGMHTTATIDYGVVISGEAILELDNKEKVTLRPGDAYVQNGTRHRWSNRGEVPAVIALTIIGAHHRNA